MDENSKKVVGMFSRYAIIILAGLGNLYIFYKILTFPTVWTVGNILTLFGTANIVENHIITSSRIIQIVPACVAGAAFFLLFLLIFSTPNIKPLKRIYATITAMLTLFILNVARILFLIPYTNQDYFETLHWIFWHLVSTVFVVGVWFLIVKIYKIKSIPVYSDLKFLYEQTKEKRTTKESKHLLKNNKSKIPLKQNNKSRTKNPKKTNRKKSKLVKKTKKSKRSK